MCTSFSSLANLVGSFDASRTWVQILLPKKKKKKKNGYKEEIERMMSNICAMLAKRLKEKTKDNNN